MSKLDIKKQLQKDEMWDFDVAYNYGFIDKPITCLLYTSDAADE